MALPLPSLRLFLPPLRLYSAALWMAVQQQKHYGIVEDFVSMVTEAVPQLLTETQKNALLLALRAKVTLSDPDPPAVFRLLDKIASVPLTTVGPVSSDSLSSVGGASVTHGSAQSALTDQLTEAEARRLLQEVFDHSFDSALQEVMSHLLTRMEQLLPVPDFRQVASWLSVAPAGLNTCLQFVSRTELQELLTNQGGSLRGVTPAVDGISEKVLLSVWSHPLLTKLGNCDPPVVLDVGGAQELKGDLPGTELTNQSSAGTKTEVVKVKDCTRNSADQSEDSVSQSDGSTSDITALQSSTHNAQRLPHKCPECKKLFSYRSQVVRHLRSNKSCSSSLTVQSQSDNTVSSKSRPLRGHTCFQCSSSFTSKADLLVHQRTHHRHLRRRTSPGPQSQADHIQAPHLQGESLSCSVCTLSFSSQTKLLRHLQTHVMEGAEPHYRCRFCEQSFSGGTQLRIHQRTHSSRSHRCDRCEKTYASLSGLRSHQVSHSTERHFLCPQCGKRFQSRDGLENHVRTHSGERPYICPYCQKRFTALAGLNVHVRQHTGERPYMCTVCGKGWPSGGDLKKHMRTHTGERPYVCQDCGKAFSISCHLTEHQRIHTGEKPFSCSECGKCLRRRFDLKKHMLSHNSVRPFACSLCPKSYTRQSHLNRHVLTHPKADDTRDDG